jgi:hypothetical protein
MRLLLSYEIVRHVSVFIVNLIHVKFHPYSSLANDFLKTLASENRGRYHSVGHRHASDGAFDAHRFAHQLIESNFENPDVSIFVTE